MAMTGGIDKIVKSVKPYSDWPSAIELHVYYKVKSQSVANNTTTLLLGMYVKTPDKYPIGAWSEYYGSYIGTATSGTNCKSFNGAIPNFYGTRWLTENQEVTVAHNADGTKTATIYWKWGVSSDSAYGYSNNSGSFDVPLTTIPRASSVSVSGAVNAGSSLTINVARASSAFTHTLRYVIGNASNTIATGVETSYAWTVPYDLLKQFRSATSGVGTIYCDTYSGTTKLGTTSCGFTVKAPDNDTTKPSASMMLSPSGDVPEVFSGLYIQGKTAVKADFTATSEYSDIKSYALTVNGKTTAGDPSTSETLSTNGEVPVVGTVTDTRGYSRTLTETIPVHAYSAPSVAVGAGQTAIVCERAKSNGISDPAGEYLRIVAKRKYSTVDGKNQCVLRFRYKTSTATSYGSWTTLIAESDTTDEYNGIVGSVTFPATTSFDVQIGVADTMESEVITTHRIPTDAVAFHIREGGKGAAFFGYSEKDGELTVNGDLHVAGNFSADNITDFVVEHGSSGDWNYRKWNSGVAEVWGKAAGAIQGAGVANNIYHGYVSVDMPSVFNAVPKSLTYSVYATSGYDWCGKAVLTSATRFNAYLLSQSNLENLNATVYAHAIGTWK